MKDFCALGQNKSRKHFYVLNEQNDSLRSDRNLTNQKLRAKSLTKIQFKRDEQFAQTSLLIKTNY